SISIVPKGSVNTVSHIDVTGFEGVYNNIPDTGVEGVIADGANMQGLVVAPNPIAQGENATINASENATWEIFTTAGATVAKGSGNQLATASLVSGNYIVKVVDNNTTFAAQIIVK
ncbi:MAG: T9SS type A sorting domain-containing protein, partial [Muribaculaceae bacterium]|nr:T9SS type A sorting domain-containing protein [Muribaculaceae bacterium]